LRELKKEESFIEKNSAKLERALETLNLSKEIDSDAGDSSETNPLFGSAKEFLCKISPFLSIV